MQIIYVHDQKIVINDKTPKRRVRKRVKRLEPYRRKGKYKDLFVD